MVAVDDLGDVVYWNDEPTRLFGHLPADAVGQSIAGFGVWPLNLFSREGAVALPGLRWEGEYDA